jgi:hypothetical protein
VSEKTTYEVESKFSVTDHASEHLEKISHHADHAAHSIESLKEGMILAAEAIGLRELVKKTAETFIGFNAAVEQSKIKLTAMIGANFHASWRRATDVAGEMYEKFEKFAEIAPVSAQEMAQFGQTTSAAVLAAGGQIKDLTEISEKGALAAKALGFEAGRGAMELNRMLAGQVGNRSLMGKMLIGSMGITAAEWKKLSAQQRLEKTEGALNSSTMKDATGALRESFGGAVAMFKDKIEVAMGKVGLPLFKAVTAEVVGWNKWIEGHPQKIAEITSKLTNGIKEAMSMMRDIGSFLMPIIKEAMSVIGTVMTFVSEHRNVIEGVVKGLLIYKGIGMAGGMVGAAGGMGGGIGGIFKELTTSLGALKTGLGGVGGATSIGGMLTSMGGALSGLIGAAGPIALFGTALFGLSKIIFGETNTEKKAREQAEKLDTTAVSWLKDYKERDALQASKKEAMAAGWSGTGDYQGINKRITELNSGESRESIIKAGIETGYINEEIANGVRKLSLTAGFNQSFSRDFPDVVNRLSDSINQVFKEAATHSTSAWGHESAIYNPKRAMGSYFEELFEEKKSEKEADLVSKVPVNQTVNITINQVSAKDPDRWLADIDDMAGRSLNAPRRTKSSLATRVGRGH